MNTPINDGGPITSSIEQQIPVAEDTYMTQSLKAVGGLSIRDWFAGMALQGYCARPDLDKECQQGFALAAYDQADAMLKARKAPSGLEG